MGDGRVNEVQVELAQARGALDDARVLFREAGTEAGVLNRLYYATFHAAQAALYARGENPSSHGHVRQQFGQRVVLDGDASRDQGRLLGELYDYRQQADYGGGEPDVDLQRLVPQVDEFVGDMEALVTNIDR